MVWLQLRNYVLSLARAFLLTKTAVPVGKLPLIGIEHLSFQDRLDWSVRSLAVKTRVLSAA